MLISKAPCALPVAYARRKTQINCGFQYRNPCSDRSNEIRIEEETGQYTIVILTVVDDVPDQIHRLADHQAGHCVNIFLRQYV